MKKLTARQQEIYNLVTQHGHDLGPEEIGQMLQPPIARQAVECHCKAIAIKVPGFGLPKRLTPKQQEIADIIDRTTATGGRAPAYVAIGRMFDPPITGQAVGQAVAAIRKKRATTNTLD